jgi:hypothetical protein
MELERPEDEPLPGDWKRMPEFDRLLLFRAVRPDRLTSALNKFVTGLLGAKYCTSQPYDLERSYQVRDVCVDCVWIYVTINSGHECDIEIETSLFIPGDFTQPTTVF